MALAETTLSAAVAVDDHSILVASATSIAEGRLLLIGGQEIMKVTKGYVAASTTVPVVRGQNGTAQNAHQSGVRIVHGEPSDFTVPPAGSIVPFPPAGRGREVKSYTAAGAITLPTPGSDMVAIISSASALAMTLANPAKDNDGDILIIIGSTAAGAHTVTYTAGFGGAGANYDVLTKQTSGTAAVMLIAFDEVWNIFPGVTGTLTNNAFALA